MNSKKKSQDASKRGKDASTVGSLSSKIISSHASYAVVNTMLCAPSCLAAR